MDQLVKNQARAVAELMFKPDGVARPSRQIVFERIKDELGFELGDYHSWKKEEFSILNGDIDIPVTFHPIENPKGVAILAHGFGQNRFFLIPYAKIFRDLGYSTLLFDQRHFGESTAKHGTFSVKESTDLVAIIDWLKENYDHSSRIITLGISMGAMTVMHALKHTDKINLAIEDSGPSDISEILPLFYKAVTQDENPYFIEEFKAISEKYGAPLDENIPILDVANSEVPLLVIHSDIDSLIPLAQGEKIIKAAKHPLSKMEIFEGYEHALSIVDYEKYNRLVTDFLASVFAEE